MASIVFDRRKFAELILFFTKGSEGDRLFGSTKLNKLLWYADFLAYGHMGRPITGATYVHQEHGPTPKPEQLLSARDELIKQGRLRVEEEETYNGTKKRLVALDEPDLTLFTEAELDLCQDALESFRRMSNIE